MLLAKFVPGEPNAVAIIFFVVFVAIALGISWWAARRTRTTEQYYAAGHTVTGFQNGLALAGDYMSAASFLGIAGLVALTGFDGLIYSIGFLVGWPIVLHRRCGVRDHPRRRRRPDAVGGRRAVARRVGERRQAR